MSVLKKQKLDPTLLVILLVLCFFAAGALVSHMVGGDKLSTYDTSLIGVYASVSDVTPTSCRLQFQSTSPSLRFSSNYMLERLENDAWYTMSYVSLRHLLPGAYGSSFLVGDETVSYKIDWSDIYGELAPGEYRFLLHPQTRRSGTYLALEFTVPE